MRTYLVIRLQNDIFFETGCTFPAVLRLTVLVMSHNNTIMFCSLNNIRKLLMNRY